MNKNTNFNRVMERALELETLRIEELKDAIKMKNMLNGSIYEDDYSLKHELAFLDNIIESLNIKKILYDAIAIKNNELIDLLLKRIDKTILEALGIMRDLLGMNCFHLRIYYVMLKRLEYNQTDNKELCKLTKLV
jgi:Na+-transporting NADH:ubiquinone oxidoreductase subunit NqrE